MQIEPYIVTLARQAQDRSYSPYSKFRVGAAVEAEDGLLFAGTNVENASYGLTICAERVAIFNAVMAGRRNIRSIAVVTDEDTPTAPCGACRQVLWEFGTADTKIVMVGRRETTQSMLGALLPMAFGPANLHTFPRRDE